MNWLQFYFQFFACSFIHFFKILAPITYYQMLVTSTNRHSARVSVTERKREIDKPSNEDTTAIKSKVCGVAKRNNLTITVYSYFGVNTFNNI